MRFYACCIDVKRVALKRPSDIDEVPNFSFDIFLKYNPIRVLGFRV